MQTTRHPLFTMCVFPFGPVSGNTTDHRAVPSGCMRHPVGVPTKTAALMSATSRSEWARS